MFPRGTNGSNQQHFPFFISQFSFAILTARSEYAQLLTLCLTNGKWVPKVKAPLEGRASVQNITARSAPDTHPRL